MQIRAQEYTAAQFDYSLRDGVAGAMADGAFWDEDPALRGRSIAQQGLTSVASFEDPGDFGVLRDQLLDRYLAESERTRYERAASRRRGQWLAGRIAAKTAAYRWLRAYRNIELADPRALSVVNSEAGVPHFHVTAAGSTVPPLRLSLSHKGSQAVAIVGTHAVGIDLERIESHGESFLALAFTAAERRLLGDADDGIEATRGWVAKEVAAKIAGTGLCGRLRQFVIDARDGSYLRVNGHWVVTQTWGDCILGWSLSSSYRRWAQDEAEQHGS